ncbi:MAG: carboxymuconolactone decarboxylase family protein [Sulfurovaceae bacterium]
MAHISLPEFEEMDPQIQEIARPILKKAGELGDIFKLLAIRKDVFFATDNMVKAYLLAKTELSYDIKESIALLVSKENGCKMCVDVHKNIAKMLGLSEERIEEILSGIDAMHSSDAEKELLRFCIRAAGKDNIISTRSPTYLDSLSNIREIICAIIVQKIRRSHGRRKETKNHARAHRAHI